MKVTVVPVFPIPGILPKNKTIIDKMVLDLNKNEMIHCMQYGNIYDEDGNVVDKIYLKKMDNIKKPVNKPVVEAPELVVLEQEKTVIENNIPEVKEETEVFINLPTRVDSGLSMPVVTEDDEYINIETEFITDKDKYTGNLYGLFEITEGTKPSVIEYKSGDNWIRFAKKFGSFQELHNGDKFVFRLTPADDSKFTIKVSIKEKNNVITYITKEIN